MTLDLASHLLRRSMYPTLAILGMHAVIGTTVWCVVGSSWSPPPIVARPTAVADPPTSQEETLACPGPLGPDLPIGLPARPELIAAVQSSEHGPWRAIAAARAPVLAVWNTTTHVVEISDNGGVSFQRAFSDGKRRLDDALMTASGTLVVQTSNALGRRDRDGHESWHPLPGGPCDVEGDCTAQLVSPDHRLMWFRDGTVAVSLDEGRTWSDPITLHEWMPRQTRPLGIWRGLVYAVAEHSLEHSELDEVWRFDGEHEVLATFDWAETSLQVSDDAGPEWTWWPKCGGAFDARQCTWSAEWTRALVFTTLRPVSGGRELAVHEHALVELCGPGARQVYRRFPFDKVDAVDWLGRPLVVRGGTLLHWSRTHGWRLLEQFGTASDGA